MIDDFKTWWKANCNSEILRDEYEQSGAGLTFKQWARKCWQWMKDN